MYNIYRLFLKVKKIFERNETLFIGIAGLLGCFFWASKVEWKEMEPSIGMITSGIMVIANLSFKKLELYDNTQKVIAEHFCKKPAFTPIDNDKCRLLIANFINDKTQQVALELTARYTQIKFTDLPHLHIRYCQNYDVYASNVLKFKDDNFCDMLFFGDVKDASDQKNYLRLNYVIDKRVSNYVVAEMTVSERYHEFTPNVITQGVITARYDFFVYFIAGITLYKKEQYLKAIMLFKKSLQYSENHEVHSFLGDCFVAINDFDNALQAVDKSLALKPDYAPSLITKANTILKIDSRNLDLSIDLLKKAIAEEPDNANAHNNIAIRYWYKKDLEKAFAHLDRSIDIEPNANAYNNRATYYKLAFPSSIMHTKKSNEDFIKCLELCSPNFHYPHHQLARNYIALHEFEKAIIHADTYIKKTGTGDTEMYMTKSLAYIGLNRNFQEAEDIAYLAYGNVKNNKNVAQKVAELASYTLVTALTRNANEILIKENEPVAFSKISIAYNMIKDLPIAEKADTYPQTVGLYAIMIYNRGQKQYALHLINEIEPHLLADNIYREKIGSIKQVLVAMQHVPDFYLQVTK
jgi:tetratricopeptide (TPR) repeat protein